MTSYDETFKRAVIQDYLSGARGFKALASRYEVNPATIQRWVGRYRQHGEAWFSQKRRRPYSAEFKRAVLRCMWREHLSYRQIAIRFDLRGNTVVSTWERLYHEGGVNALKPKCRTRSKKMRMKMTLPEPEPSVPTDDKRTIKALRKENEYLRAEVAYLKKLDALVRAQQAAPKKRKPSSD